MTQEDKEVLIKDLCARLPYRTIVQMQLPLGKIDTNLDYNVIYNIENDDLSIKQYLFPMSSMTEEQREEYNSLVTEELMEVINDEEEIKPEYKYIDWLNKNHFDYRGLIDKGLAIDATNLNIY